MANFSEPQLLQFLKTRDNHFINSKQMELGWLEESGIWTFLDVSGYEDGANEVTISTMDDNLYDFIEGFKLHELEDIDQLGYNNSWARYLNSGGEMIIRPLELEADLKFKIIRNKTIIFSMDLHFYDEVSGHLTMPEDFEKYVIENDNRLLAAKENRYRVANHIVRFK